MGGLDVVYKIELAQRSFIYVNVVVPFVSKLYFRSDNCIIGEMVYCAQIELMIMLLELGDYYFFVDLDAAGVKGNFILGVFIILAPLFGNDICTMVMILNFGFDGVVSYVGTNFYGLDQYKGLCSVLNNLGVDSVYELDVGSG